MNVDTCGKISLQSIMATLRRFFVINYNHKNGKNRVVRIELQHMLIMCAWYILNAS